jgi:hypothetical protein
VNLPGGPGKLPLAIRNPSLACMALSAIVGFVSLSELLGLAQVSQPNRPPIEVPALGNEALQKGYEARLLAVESMRVPRVLILSSLGLVCALNFVSASRLLWPRGLRRESMRGIVVSSSVAAAVLRTLDGAQLAVVMRKVGAAVARSAGVFPALSSLTPAELEASARAWAVAIAVVQTSAVVGAFAVLSQYFRMQKVKQLIAALDKPH